MRSARAHRSLVLAAVLAATAWTPLQAQQSDEARHSATFRAAHLATALETLVELTSVDLIYDDALVEGVEIYCAIQDARPADILRCMLDGTGLDFVVSSTGAFVLIRAPEEVVRRARIAGRVVDAETGEPLPFAHVFLADAGTTTNADGLFALGDLMPGWYRVLASFVGYETASTGVYYIGAGDSESVTIPLRAAAGTMSPIVVDGLTQRPLSDRLGLTEIEAESTRAFGMTSTPDVARGATAALGVSSALPFADLHIQGGNTAEHVTRLDGVPIRDPVALGRYLGAFSPLAVGLISVHTGGFGAARGSHLTGTIDARHRLNFVDPEAALQVDPVSINLRAGTPFSSGHVRGSSMIALRHSAWPLHADAGIEDLFVRANQIDPLLTGLWLGYPIRSTDLITQRQIPDVRFSDLHAAMTVRPDPLTTVSGSLYRAGNYVATTHSAVWEDPRYSSLLTFDDVYDWRNWAGQASFSRIIGARAVASVSSHVAIHTSSYDYDYRRDPFSGSLADGFPENASAGAAHSLHEVGLAGTLAYSLTRGTQFESGISVDFTEAAFTAANAWISSLSLSSAESRVAGYIEGRHALTSGITLEAGSRLTFLPSGGSWFAEPRASVRFDGALGDVSGFALRGSAGVYRQFVSGIAFRNAGPAAIVPELWFWIPSGPDLDPPRSVFAGFDAALFLQHGLSVHAEAFYRRDHGIPALDTPRLGSHVGNDAEAGPADPLASLHGRAVGAGAGLQLSGARGLAAISYSFETATRTRPGSPVSTAIAVPWEEPHRLSLDGRLNIGAFSLHSSARGVWGRKWALRRAYYDFLGAEESIGDQVLSPQDDVLPALLLADVSGAYRLSAGPIGLRLEAGIANVFNRHNVVDYSLEATGPQSALLSRTLPGRRLTFAVRVSF